jgi:hypothetical protein
MILATKNGIDFRSRPVRIIGRIVRATMATIDANRMARFQSLSHVPVETRRLLRDRFDRKLRVHRQAHHVNTELPVMPDERMLQLLLDLEVIFDAEWVRAESVYAGANPASGEPANLRLLTDTGWARVIWGRVTISQDLHRRVARAPAGSIPGLTALRNRIFTRKYRGTEAIRRDAELSVHVESIESGLEDPAQIVCNNPAWVAARLWERRATESGANDLRRWVDLWGILQHPTLIPGDAWRPRDAQAFRTSAMSVIESERGLGGWVETRSAYVQRVALVNDIHSAQAESRIPQPPVTLVGRALWFADRTIEHCGYEALDSCGDVFGLVRLLLADAVSEENAPAPHPMAVRLFDQAIDRPELLLCVLFQVRAYPKLLADLILHPPTTALACLLVAQWQAPSGAWDRNLVQRDDKVAQGDAFADAASILGDYLRNGKASPAEVAALVNWFHERAGPGFIDDAANEAMLETLRRELIGAPKAMAHEMAASLDGPELRRGLGTSEYAAVLDLISLGGLADDPGHAGVVDAYVDSIRTDDFRLSAHRIGVASAAALARMAARTPETRREFLYPLQVAERLAAAAPDENPYTLARAIANSIRAHIRILSRAIVGSADDIPSDLVDALLAAVKAGALDHKERGRIASFSPRLDRGISGPSIDRPIAADLSSALRVLSPASQEDLLGVLLETDEPMILAQMLTLIPPAFRDRVNRRLTALAPADAGAILSLFEIQARIEELLAAGADAAAARYMEAEIQLQTWGPARGRELARFQNQLRLQYLRNEWTAILSTPRPTFKDAQDQSSAQDTLLLFKGIAMLKEPTPDPVAAKQTFIDLFARRPSVACATNWFAAEISRLLPADSFALLKGGDIQEGRRALSELERMLALTPAGTPLDDEVIECNKAILVLALGEPGQALAIITSVSLVRLQETAASCRAVALARLSKNSEAIAVLDQAEYVHGKTTMLSAVRKHITGGTAHYLVPEVSFKDDRLRDIALAVARFRTAMHPADQARVLSTHADPLEGLVVEHVRAAAGSVVSLVPMMSGVQIDAVEDDLTAFIEELLVARVHFLGWSTDGQSKGGFTAKGNPGERDLVLKWGNTTLAVIEAVVCDQPLSHDSMRADLESHFQKLLSYGNPTLFFHLTYAYVEDKASLLTFLERIADSAQPPGFSFKGREPIPHTDSRPPGFIARYEGDFGEVKVIFLVLNMGQQRQRDTAKVAAATKARKSSKPKKAGK